MKKEDVTDFYLADKSTYRLTYCSKEAYSLDDVMFISRRILNRYPLANITITKTSLDLDEHIIRFDIPNVNNL